MPGPGGVPWQAVYAAGPAGWQHAQQALAAAAASGFRSGGGGMVGPGPGSGGWSPQQYEQYMAAMQQYEGGSGGPPPPGLPPYGPSMGGGGPPPPPPTGGGGDWRQQLLQQQQGSNPQGSDLSSLNQAEVSLILSVLPWVVVLHPPPPMGQPQRGDQPGRGKLHPVFRRCLHALHGCSPPRPLPGRAEDPTVLNSHTFPFHTPALPSYTLPLPLHPRT